MTEEVEDQLLRMAHHLKKLHKHKSLKNTKCEKQSDGKIKINSATSTVRGHVFNLANKVEYTRFVTIMGFFCFKEKSLFFCNEFSPEILNRQSESMNSAGTTSHSTSSRPSSPPPESHTPFLTSEPSSNLSIHERSYIQCKYVCFCCSSVSCSLGVLFTDRMASCNVELTTLINRQQEHYLETVR